MLTDLQLQQNAMAELRWEPSVKAAEIGVAVNGGVVTLTGKVDNYAQKFAAERAVERVAGVRAIADDLVVTLLGAYERTDADVARAAANALAWDVEVPDGVTVIVSQGWVTLAGKTQWFYEKAAAERTVRYLMGVTGVTNTITVELQMPVKAVDVRASIEAAFVRNVELDAKTIKVSTPHDDTVTLTGTVRSWAERVDATHAAWNAPGVRFVKDELLVAR
jgi:osmotically-inducible protein OsmY